MKQIQNEEPNNSNVNYYVRNEINKKENRKRKTYEKNAQKTARVRL